MAGTQGNGALLVSIESGASQCMAVVGWLRGS